MDTRFEPVRAGIYLGWKEDDRSYPIPREGRALVALDLRTGREIWRLPGFSDQPAVIFAGELALLRKNSSTIALSITSGKPRWTSPACAFREHLQVTGGGGQEIGAGLCHEPVLQPVLRAPLPIPVLQGPRRRFVHGLSCRDTVYEFDLRTGAPRGTYVLPDRLGTDQSDPRLLPLQDGGLLVVAGRRNHPPMMARFAAPGSAPKLSPVPGGRHGMLAVQEGALVLSNHRKRESALEAYGGFAPIPRR